MNYLTPTSPDKTVVFSTPVEGYDILIRTGVNTESNVAKTFLSAVLQSYDNTLKHSEINNAISSLSKKLNDDMTKQKWSLNSASVIYKIPFLEDVVLKLQKFYNYVENDDGYKTQQIKQFIKSNDDIEIFQVIFHMVKYNQLSSFLKQIINEHKNDDMLNIIKIIESELPIFLQNILSKYSNKLSEYKRQKCIEKISDLVLNILNECEQNSYSEYLEKNKNKTKLIYDEFFLTVLSDRLDRDIYVFSNTTRLPIEININKNRFKKRKSILIIDYNNDTFDRVGKVINEHKYIYSFYKDDPSIKRIYTFMFEKEKVSDLYPSLVKYIPDKFKSNKRFNASCSHSPNRKKRLFFYDSKSSSSSMDEDRDEY